jgi:hypothetical protein
MEGLQRKRQFPKVPAYVLSVTTSKSYYPKKSISITTDICLNKTVTKVAA